MSTDPGDETGLDEGGLDPADETALSMVGAAFGRLHLDHPLEQICARGAGIRRRRRAVPMLGVSAVALAGLVAAALVPAGGAAPAAGRPRVIADLAAFTVSSNADGTVTVQFKEFGDGPALEQILDKAGIRSLVFENRHPPTMNPEPPQCDLGAKMTAKERAQLNAVADFDRQDELMMTLVPSAMPAGATLVFRIDYYGTEAGDHQSVAPVMVFAPSLFDGAVPDAGCGTGALPATQGTTSGSQG